MKTFKESWMYYTVHPIMFLIIVFGIGLALVWNFIEEHEEQIDNFFKKVKQWKSHV